MAPAYKLSYFQLQGATKAAAFLLKYGGLEFEKDEIKREDWPELKETFPFGQLPVLEHNGKKMNQSVAICRYLAKIVKLAGKDEWEDLEIDAIVDTIKDIRSQMLPVFRETDEEKKTALKETALNETIPYFLTRLEVIAERNHGHLAAKRLTWADFFLIALAPLYDAFVGGNVFEEYPNLKKLRDEVEALPAVKEEIENA